MSDFEEKYDYQEIMVEGISQIYQIANDYNSFYDLPRFQIVLYKMEWTY